jgi:glycosyltransferase involved in cell wall biosynthesis
LKACIVIPAYDAARTVGEVIRALKPTAPIIVIDDGSRDATRDVARRAGAEVLSHDRNHGKGAALVTGLTHAQARGFDVALTVDADGQHPAESALRVLQGAEDRRALVLGIRDLVRGGAPRANQMSNGISNFFLSRFTGRPLADTQCGLRRYPVKETLALGSSAAGYAFEAEVLLRALAAGLPLVEVPIDVIYPQDRVTHFHKVKDPARIISTVLRTLFDLRVRGAARRTVQEPVE